MRSMFVEFPDDPTCRTLDRQYMFGPDLLVAPVFTYSGDVEYYLPAGTWTNWFTGEKVVSEHGVWRNERHGFDTIPLWVRDGSVLVTKPGAETPEYEYGKDAEEMETVIDKNRKDYDPYADTLSRFDDGNVEVDYDSMPDYQDIPQVDVDAFQQVYGTPLDTSAPRVDDIMSIEPNTEYRDAEGNTIC